MPRDMDFRAALAASVLLAATAFGLLWIADGATGVAAIAGGIGLVIAGSLLGLTILARRWERERSRYVQTVMDASIAAHAPGETTRETKSA